MKFKRFGWLLSIVASQDLKLKAVFGLVVSVFMLRDAYFVNRKLGVKKDPKGKS